MRNSIKIIDSKLPLVFYKNRPVTTMSQIDELHKRPYNTARRNFHTNRKHFIDGVDFFEVDYAEWSALLGRKAACSKAGGHTKFVCPPNKGGGHSGKMYLFTQTGYLMLVKSFTDDLAWQVQRSLVQSYFNKRQAPPRLTRKEIVSFKLDIVSGLGTVEVARKHGRAVSTVRKYTVNERKAMQSPRQLMLPCVEAN